MLEVDGLSVRFGGVKAVDQVSLGVGERQIVGLVGPNGSGKSTLLNALSGIVPCRGTVRLDGQRVRLGRPLTMARAGVMRTFQTPQTFLALSCIENVLLSSRFRQGTGLAGSWLARPRMWRAERARWEQAAAALDRVGLLHAAEAPAAPLSYGQQRLLEIARAMAGKPRLIMLDEPAAGLNAAETRALVELLRQLRDDGVALLVVEHKIDVIDRLCDRVVVLRLGQVVADGPPAEVWNDPGVMDAYLGTVG